jgi:hypothetical protein
MTEDDLKAIEARAQAATEGPWRAVYDGSSTWSIGPDDDPQGRAACWASDRFGKKADIEFLTAARTDIPALVAEVRRLRALLANAAPGQV